MYYGANVDAKIFMGQSVLATLPAPGSDTWKEVPLTGSISVPANVLSTAFFNVTNDGVRRSIGGKLGDQSSEGNVVLDWEAVDGVHKAMFNDSRLPGGQRRNWYIDYPNGRRLDFKGFVSSWTEEAFDAGEDAKEHRANWTISIDGAVTVTEAV